MTERSVWRSWFEFLFSCLGLMVGLGNVWRFPYICFKNGGGAFVITYALFVGLTAMPLLFLEMTVAQYSNLGAVKVWECCPFFKGIGYGCTTFISIISVYYNVIVTWTLYYFALSFSPVLPWTSCTNEWNTKQCLNRIEEYNKSYNKTQMMVNSSLQQISINDSLQIKGWEINHTSELITSLSYVDYSNVTSSSESVLMTTSPTEEFWERNVLQLSSGIDDIGTLRWPLVLCLIVSWIIVFLALLKGIKSSGKVMYVLATIPYVFLLILFIRGLTLPGSLDGLRYFLLPKWERLADFTVWTDAAVQAFYSASLGGGVILTMSSHNQFHNNCYRDAMVIPVLDALTSIFAGCAVFSTLGYMANTVKVDIQDVVKQGPGIAFMVYPEALSSLPFPQIWSVIFFLTLYTVGVNTEINQIQCITTNILDRFPNLRSKERIVTLCLCVTFFLLGIIFTTQGGMFILQLIDYYLPLFSGMVFCLLETIVISWIYGSDRLLEDLEMMIGYRPSSMWKVVWKFVAPIIVLVIWVCTLTQVKHVTYGDKEYPYWALVIGWISAIACILPLPTGMVHELLKRQGDMLERIKVSVKPTKMWKPALPIDQQDEMKFIQMEKMDGVAVNGNI